MRKNKAYKTYIKSLPCAYCGRLGTCAHHVRQDIPECFKGGTGLKPFDVMCISLCAECHDRVHRFPEFHEELNVKDEIMRNMGMYISENMF